jgi:hypothetical protein
MCMTRQGEGVGIGDAICLEVMREQGKGWSTRWMTPACSHTRTRSLELLLGVWVVDLLEAPAGLVALASQAGRPDVPLGKDRNVRLGAPYDWFTLILVVQGSRLNDVLGRRFLGWMLAPRPSPLQLSSRPVISRA